MACLCSFLIIHRSSCGKEWIQIYFEDSSSDDEPESSFQGKRVCGHATGRVRGGDSSRQQGKGHCGGKASNTSGLGGTSATHEPRDSIDIKIVEVSSVVVVLHDTGVSGLPSSWPANPAVGQRKFNLAAFLAANRSGLTPVCMVLRELTEGMVSHSTTMLEFATSWVCAAVGCISPSWDPQGQKSQKGLEYQQSSGALPVVWPSYVSTLWANWNIHSLGDTGGRGGVPRQAFVKGIAACRSCQK